MDVPAMKQACLDLSKHALALYDRLEEHGAEAAWKGDGALIVVRLARSYEALRDPLSRQATNRLLAMGVPPEQLLR